MKEVKTISCELSPEIHHYIKKMEDSKKLLNVFLLKSSALIAENDKKHSEDKIIKCHPLPK